MRNLLTRSTVLAAALACSPLAFAAGPQQAAAPQGSAAPNAQAQRAPNLFDELGLTDKQRASVRQAMQENFQQARPQLETLNQKRAAFNNATPGSSQFQAAANDLAQTESTAAHDEVLRQAALRTKIYNLLTSEQRTKLATLRAQAEQRARQQQQAAPAASR